MRNKPNVVLENHDAVGEFHGRADGRLLVHDRVAPAGRHKKHIACFLAADDGMRPVAAVSVFGSCCQQRVAELEKQELAESGGD